MELKKNKEKQKRKERIGDVYTKPRKSFTKTSVIYTFPIAHTWEAIYFQVLISPAVYRSPNFETIEIRKPWSDQKIGFAVGGSTCDNK